jgi:hypothetical protein
VPISCSRTSGCSGGTRRPPIGFAEEAIREIFEHFDVDGPGIVAIHQQPNDKSSSLGLVGVRDEQLREQAKCWDRSGREDSARRGPRRRATRQVVSGRSAASAADDYA